MFYYMASSVSGQDEPNPALKNFLESHIINPLLTKLLRSRWLGIGLVLFFCKFLHLDSVSVHKHAKKELLICQYPAILTEQTWSITHIYWSTFNLLLLIPFSYMSVFTVSDGSSCGKGFLARRSCSSSVSLSV